MMRSLDFDRAMRARFENGRHVDALMTRWRKAAREIAYGTPMAAEQRRSLETLRFLIAGSIDDLLECDRIMAEHAKPAPKSEPEHVGTFTQVGVPAAAVARSIGVEMNRQRLIALKNLVASIDVTDAAADVFKQKDAAE